VRGLKAVQLPGEETAACLLTCPALAEPGRAAGAEGHPAAWPPSAQG